MADLTSTYQDIENLSIKLDKAIQEIETSTGEPIQYCFLMRPELWRLLNKACVVSKRKHKNIRINPPWRRGNNEYRLQRKIRQTIRGNTYNR